MQFTTTHKEEHKKGREGAPLFFFDETFLTFLIFYRTLHLETYALTRFFSKSASWCVFSLSHPSLLLLPLRVV